MTKCSLHLQRKIRNQLDMIQIFMLLMKVSIFNIFAQTFSFFSLLILLIVDTVTVSEDIARSLTHDFDFLKIDAKCLKSAVIFFLESDTCSSLESSDFLSSRIMLIFKNLKYFSFSKTIDVNDLDALHVMIKECQSILDVINR